MLQASVPVQRVLRKQLPLVQLPSEQVLMPLEQVLLPLEQVQQASLLPSVLPS